jgi:hypothetical protein
MGMAVKTIKFITRVGMNAERSSGGDFCCENEQHIAHGDDGSHKQDDAHTAGRAHIIMNAGTVNPDTMSRTPLRRSHQAMLASFSGSGRSELRVAVNELTTYWARSR